MKIAPAVVPNSIFWMTFDRCDPCNIISINLPN